jgi:hypothetical protein
MEDSCQLSQSPRSISAAEVGEQSRPKPRTSRVEAKPSKPAASQEAKLFPERLNVTPAQMVELAPRLAPYMPPRYDEKSWPELPYWQRERATQGTRISGRLLRP